MKIIPAFIISTSLLLSPSAFAEMSASLNVNSQTDDCKLDKNSNLVHCQYNSSKSGKYKWIDTSRIDPFTDKKIHEIRLHPSKYSYLPDPSANIGKIFLIARCSEGEANILFETGRISNKTLDIAYRIDDNDAIRSILIPIKKHYNNVFRPPHLRNSLKDNMLSSKKLIIKTYMPDNKQGKFFAEYDLDHFDDASLKTLSYCFPNNEFSRKILNRHPQYFLD